MGSSTLPASAQRAIPFRAPVRERGPEADSPEADSPASTAALEPLECRYLLSAGFGPPAHPCAHPAAASGGTVVDGYTPQQVRHAYGFDQISFGNGAIKADGTGQTVALIDAYHYPQLQSDLHVFDLQFGLPDPPSLRVVSQTGGSVSRLKVDTGWAGETAMDVQLAHAIAPGAAIIVIECNSDSTDDLVAGANYARKLAGVSVVSMSWAGAEVRGQNKMDRTFTTPTGHAGVNFVASSRDDRLRAGAQCP